MILQRIIPEFRERAGLSIEDAYQAIGLEPELYKRYEEGEAAIPLDVLYRMSSCFGVTVEATLQGGSPRARVRIEYEPNGEIKALLEELDSSKEKAAEDRDEGPEETGEEKRDRRIVRKPLDADDIPAARKILDWQPRHVTGLTFFDDPHKSFVDITNALYAASLGGWDKAREAFTETIRYMAKYVQDMRNEEIMMKRTGYFDYGVHRREHYLFLKEISRQIQKYRKGQEVNLRNLVQFLKDWNLSHMSIGDRNFISYLNLLKRYGLLGGIIMRVKKTEDGVIIQ